MNLTVVAALLLATLLWRCMVFKEEGFVESLNVEGRKEEQMNSWFPKLLFDLVF